MEAPPTGTEVLHNIVYRARVDGVSRGATITYAAEGDQTQTANPTMVPGRVVDINTVLPASGLATMKVQVKWPYSANLHCEILVDDQLVAQADDFVAPRLIPNRDDPDFGSLSCQAPVTAEALPAPVDPAAPRRPRTRRHRRPDRRTARPGRPPLARVGKLPHVKMRAKGGSLPHVNVRAW